MGNGEWGMDSRFPILDSRCGNCWYDGAPQVTERTQMPITAKWIFTAAMDVDPDREAVFNEIYDQEHVPIISKVPGVISVTRLKLDTLRMTMGGETKVMDPQGAPRYAAVYELDSPDVLTSPAFASAVDQGRWPKEVRPYTKNRHHTLYRVMSDE